MSDGKILIFLESNTKKITIKSFLGSDYTIFATGGHLLDLVKNGPYNLGVDLQNFKPSYEVIDRKKSLVKFWNEYLEKNKPSQIFLATDPDREGEAIAHEIVETLSLSEGEYKRLLFHEITSSGVKKSLENPLDIDKNLAEAQLSRQVLDRMIGFCLSTLLQKKIQAWSAGRVQSVVLKLIVDREREIINYGDKKEFVLFASYSVKRNVYQLNERTSEGDSKFYKTIEEAEKSKEDLGNVFELQNKIEKEKFAFPKQPLTTSLLLYEAKTQLGYSIYKTTTLAQQLYEGITLKSKNKRLSLITYPRTDSIRISKVFTNRAYEYIKNKWGLEFCNFKDTSSSSKGKKANVQDAHEAIRPTYLNYTPEDLKDEDLDESQFKLYELIFNHTISTLMQPAKYLNKVYYYLNGDRNFEMVENVIISPGFFILLENYYKNYRIKKTSNLKDEDMQKIETDKVSIEEYLGSIPKRYTEGTLIKQLERLGIGRPSTYNTFSKIIIKRRYSIFDKKGNFLPTELGFKVNDWLQTYFALLINENYTASLEQQLDKISQGENTYLEFIKDFWSNFYPNYKKLDEEEQII
jgi:DNA topoisomerase-1